MDEIELWRWLLFIITDSFAIFNAFLLIQWRKSMHTMKWITGLCIVFLILFTMVCAYSERSISLSWPLMAVFLMILAWGLSEYRDARTLFGFLSIWTFSVSAYLLIVSAALWIFSLSLRVLVAIGINSLFSYCVYFQMRSPYAQITKLGKKGWMMACCILILPFSLTILLAKYLKKNPSAVSIVAGVAISMLIIYLVVAKLISRIYEQKAKEQAFDLLSEQMKSTERQIDEATRREKQSAILRHDLHHFANVISSCIQRQHYEQAMESVQSLLSHPAMKEPEKYWCKNPVINALLISYVPKAEYEGITFQIRSAIREDLGVDTMELAVTLSNLLENALNACIKEPADKERAICVKLHMAGEQLFIAVSNTCSKKVHLNVYTGLPQVETKQTEHGLGLVSVQSFINKYRGQVNCQQEDNWFHLRIVVSESKEEKKKEHPKLNKRTNTSIVRVNLIIVGLIIAGFLMAGIVSCFSLGQLFKSDIESVSALTSESVYANMNNLMERPIYVSLTMAHDTLLQNLMLQEAKKGKSPEKTSTIQAYLASYQKQYGFDSVFLISKSTNTYYHYKNGIDRKMIPENKEDAWYYKFLKSNAEYSLNVDKDLVRDGKITVFVNCKIKNLDGSLLGVIGVGIEITHIQDFFKKSEKQYDLSVYLVDQKGNVQLSSTLTSLENVNLFEDPIFADIKQTIMEDKIIMEQSWYSDNKQDGYIITKYIKNVNWYLIVKKDTKKFYPIILQPLFTGLLFMVIVASIVALIVTSILTRYHSILVGKVERDNLTGLRNRISCEEEMHIYNGRISDFSNIGIGIFDLNNLKQINTTFGYQIGDMCIQLFSKLLCQSFSHSPAFRIGGDEFLIVFLNMEEQEIREKWRMLCIALEQQGKEKGVLISVSFGFAFRDEKNLVDMNAIFQEADRRMQKEKQERK